MMRTRIPITRVSEVIKRRKSKTLRLIFNRRRGISKKGTTNEALHMLEGKYQTHEGDNSKSK